MKKSFKVLTWIDTGIFPASIMFCSGFSYKEMTLLLKKKKASDWLLGIRDDEVFLKKEGTWGVGMKRTIENKKLKTSKVLYYIIIKDFDFSDGDYCKLAHEVLHICQFFLPDVLNRDDEHEAEAYLHTYVMGKCLRAIRGNA